MNHIESLSIQKSTTIKPIAHDLSAKPGLSENRYDPFEGDKPDLEYLYKEEIGKIPQLTAQEEIDLRREIREYDTVAHSADMALHDPLATDQEKKEAHLAKTTAEENRKAKKLRFFEANLLLVTYTANIYRDRLPYMDLIQEGNIGLDKAIEKYDETRGLRFSTLAIPWIKNEMNLAIMHQGRSVLSYEHWKQRGYIRKAEEKLVAHLCRQPTNEEIAQEVAETIIRKKRDKKEKSNWKAEDVQRIKSYFQTLESLDVDHNDIDEDFDRQTLADTLECPEINLLENALQREIHDAIEEALSILTQGQRFILDQRADGKTFEEIAGIRGSSKQAVHIINERMNEKFKKSDKIQFLKKYW